MTISQIQKESTKQKLLESARTLFTQQGYAATTSREIAEHAGINLALLNYHFKTKENLFQIIMFDAFKNIFGSIGVALNDTNLNLEQRISKLCETYLDNLCNTPDLPLFIFNEIKNNPQEFISKTQMHHILLNSIFFKELKSLNTEINPIQIFLNVLSLIIFPFVVRPMLLSAEVFTHQSFTNMVQLRKQYIPEWISLIINHEINRS